MKAFMDKDFLLNNPTAVELYENYAKDMPIYDYHCHLNPKEIAENKRYRNITEIWLGGDHYKWRAMRAMGIDERYITGDASDYEKFLKWAETIPNCIGNPLYHWTHLELKRFFGIDQLLSVETADQIWNRCNELLQKDDFTARSLIERSNVKALCTTDDPTDTLEYHQALAKDASFKVKVYPAWRPDKALNIEKPGFREWIAKLGKVTGMEIKTFDDLTKALLQRLEYFHRMGCRLSDHAADPVLYEESTAAEVTAILQKGLRGESLSAKEIAQFKTELLVFLGREYARHGWVMQLHIGTIRNNSQRMMRLLGPDTGFDAIADYTFGVALSRFMDKLDSTDELPKTVLYCLNPRDNEMLASLAGCFQGGGVAGKIQFGSGWWFNDQKDGMIRQLVALANIGLLPLFVGMLTDSRSFLSYTRHEYFRRVLCNLIGEWVESGEVPNNIQHLGTIVQNICYRNAEKYFGIR
ncbi:MAG TPA: glucuronate isomerase [Bacillota bacterium]